MFPWEKYYLEGSEGASKEKAYIARNIPLKKIQTKDNLDTHDKFTNTTFWK